MDLVKCSRHRSGVYTGPICDAGRRLRSVLPGTPIRRLGGMRLEETIVITEGN